MNSITALRVELADIFSGLKAKTIDNKDAQAMINAAGKMINCVKLQLEYQQLLGTGIKIVFLDEDPGE
ncbi:MAG: hypothetical protein E2O80_01980 [Betaproteobacteria bacterium]|nr:MAG: hypothetical protein E2O80_01980 [Betaproteobacteria bacterium]